MYTILSCPEKTCGGAGQAPRARVSEGRRLAIRQLPRNPASRPPATARITASTITPSVTDGCTGTATTWDAVAGFWVGTPPPVPAACENATEDPGTVADTFGATAAMIATPANPRPTPAAAGGPPLTLSAGWPR